MGLLKCQLGKKGLCVALLRANKWRFMSFGLCDRRQCKYRNRFSNCIIPDATADGLPLLPGAFHFLDDWMNGAATVISALPQSKN